MAGKPGSRGWGHVRKLPSGRFQASYIGPDLRRHNAPLTYTKRTRAEGWLADERDMIEAKRWTPPAARKAVEKAVAITVADAAKRWVAERDLKPRTRIEYERTLGSYITPSMLGPLPLTEVDAAMVRTWYAGLDASKKARRAHAYGLLHAVMATAVSDGLIAANPCQIKAATTVRTQRWPVILTPVELATVADAVPERLRAAILVAAWCGPRWGELIELRRKDIGAGCETITIGRGATHRGECRIDTPKSGKGRTVVVPPHIRADLKHHLDVYAAKGAEGLVFPPARGGCHFNDRVFRDAIAPALDSIGKGGMRIHDLRHFAGTQAARVGNLTETMARLGHSTVNASLIYQGVVSGRDAEVAAALSKLAEGSES